MSYKKYILALLLVTNATQSIQIFPRFMMWEHHQEQIRFKMLIFGIPAACIGGIAFLIGSTAHIIYTARKEKPELTKKVAKKWLLAGGIVGSALAIWLTANIFRIGVK